MDIVPHGFNASIEQAQEEHQQAITNHGNQIQVIQYENSGLYSKNCANGQQIERCENIINCLKERYFDYVMNPGLQNAVMKTHKDKTKYNDTLILNTAYHVYRGFLLQERENGYKNNFQEVKRFLCQTTLTGDTYLTVLKRKVM